MQSPNRREYIIVKRKTVQLALGLGIIAIVLAAIVFFLLNNINGYFSSSVGVKNIGISCVAVSSPTTYGCRIDSADEGVDFSQVGAQVLSSNGTLLGGWPPSVAFGKGGFVSIRSALTPVGGGSGIIDDGDGKFGIHDAIYVVAASGASLLGLTLKLSGGGASGSAALS